MSVILLLVSMAAQESLPSSTGGSGFVCAGGMLCECAMQTISVSYSDTCLLYALRKLADGSDSH